MRNCGRFRRTSPAGSITTFTDRRSGEAGLRRHAVLARDFRSGDEWAKAARATDVSDASLVTTEEVLSEFLTAISAHAEHTRRLACRLVREILKDPGIEVFAQSHESFLAGLALYERRAV
jgi:hypothetical protein